MNIRPFLPEDAEFCFKVRTRAFVLKFHGELTPEAVVAGVNAYMPNDYVRMAERMPFFVVEDKGSPIGFFTIRRLDDATAEIPLIYLDLRHLGKGIGTACIGFIEKWLATHWKEVERLIVETVIPQYNGGFYQRAGFAPIGQTLSEFPDSKVPALRLCKKLKH